MSSLIAILAKKIDIEQIENSMRENNCELKVPSSFSPNAIYSFDRLSKENVIHLTERESIADYLFLEDSFKKVGCIAVIELSKGQKSPEKVFAQLQGGYRQLEQLLGRLSSDHNSVIGRAEKFAIYCGSYNKKTRNRIKKLAKRRKGNDREVAQRSLKAIQFCGGRVKYRKCECGDSIDIIKT